MQCCLCSLSSRGRSGLMVRVSDKGLGFESQIDPGYFFFVDLCLTLSTKKGIIHEHLLLRLVNNMQPLNKWLDEIAFLFLQGAS